VLVPCLATNWMKPELKDAIPFSFFFNAFLDALPQAPRPTNVYLSLYSQWPSTVLEDATLALNSAWGQRTTKFYDICPFYRRDFRLTMLFLELCLIVCAFRIDLTLKSFLISSVAFVGLSLGNDKWVQFFVPQDRPNLQLVLQLAILSVLSIGFPVVVRWNPKDLFGKREEEQE
jgi:hypothetical protein